MTQTVARHKRKDARETSLTGVFIFLWWRWRDLNPRPMDYDSTALPTELHRLVIFKRPKRYRRVLNVSRKAGTTQTTRRRKNYGRGSSRFS